MPSQPRTLAPADEMRLLGRLAVQPFLAFVLTLIVYPLVFPDRYPGVDIGPALYFGLAAVFITIAFALPTVVWLVKRQPVPLTLSLIAGLAFSNFPVVLAMAGGGGGLRMHVFASVLGLVGAAVFWLISIRGRDFSRDQVSA